LSWSRSAPYSSITECPSLKIELPDITHVPSRNPVALIGNFSVLGSHVVTPISMEPLQEFTLACNEKHHSNKFLHEFHKGEYSRVPINRPPKQFCIIATISARKLINQPSHQLLQQSVCTKCLSFLHVSIFCLLKFLLPDLKGHSHRFR
jgi:hypothetical protein